MRHVLCIADTRIAYRQCAAEDKRLALTKRIASNTLSLAEAQKKRQGMTTIDGYIDGNAVIALDGELSNFTGSEILIRLVEKPKEPPAAQEKPAENERQKALQTIRGVLKTCGETTIENIREGRMAERYGL